MATMSPPRPPILNIPNQLTAARFVLAVILFGLIEYEMWWSSLGVFAIAAFTDWLDGYMARKQGITSTLGRNLDPLVDKLLICGAYIFLLPFGMAFDEPQKRWLLPWMVTVIVSRELIITSLRSFMEMYNVQFGADWAGKVKMGLQCAALLCIFFEQGLAAHAAATETVRMFGVARDGLIWAMLAATAYSGLQYLAKATTALMADAKR